MKSLTFITGNASKAAQLGQYLQLLITHTTLDIPEIQSLDGRSKDYSPFSNFQLR